MPQLVEGAEAGEERVNLNHADPRCRVKID